MNFDKLIKDTGITLEIIYFLLLLIIIYYLYSISNNLNKEYFSISSSIGAKHLSSRILNIMHSNKCGGLISMIQNQEDIENIRPEDIVYLVNTCDNFSKLDTVIQNQLRNAANTVDQNSLIKLPL